MSSPGSYLSGEVILEEVEAASLPGFRYISWGILNVSSFALLYVKTENQWKAYFSVLCRALY